MLIRTIQNAILQDTLSSNPSKCGLPIVVSNMTIVHGLFEGNNQSIAGYPSVRRNILRAGDGSSMLNMSSLNGGDEQEKNTSLWILNDE